MIFCAVITPSSFVFIVQHGNDVLGVIFQLFDTVGGLLIGVDVWKRRSGNAFQRSGAVRCDKVFEVDSPAEHVAFIDHEKGRDVVVFARLTYQCIHSLLYRHILADDYAVGSHAAAYLVVIERGDEPKLGAYGRLYRFEDKAASVFIRFREYIHGGIGIELGYQLCRLVNIHLAEVLARLFFLEVLEYLCEHFKAAHAVKFLSVLNGKRADHLGNIAAVVIVEPVHHSLRRIVSTDDSRYLIERGDVFEFSILHWFVLRFILLT